MKRRFYIIVSCFLLLIACKQKAPVQKTDTRTAAFSKITDTAKMYHSLQKPEMAIKYYKRALQNAQKNNLPRQQAETLLHIAKLLPQRDADTSLHYLNNALHIARALKHKQLQSDIYHSIAQIHKQQRDYEAALFALEAHHRLTDSLLEEHQRKDIEQVKAQRNAVYERSIAILICTALLIIALVFALFLRRTQKLNQKLALQVEVTNKLFSIISHDLRGPAGSLKQGLELVDSASITIEELPNFLKLLKKQSIVLNETLDTMLIWSRSQLNELRQNPVVFSPLPVIQNNLALMEGQYMSKNLSFDLDVPADVTIYADRDQFDFIIRNLLSNAIKFSLENGTIALNVSRENHRATFTVRDYGVGISTERQQQFLSGNLETTFGTSGEKGTGLGLRMVKDFINAAGGSISLESRKGNTCFSFTLPHQNA
jgi:signal transduction histidine kinase